MRYIFPCLIGGALAMLVASGVRDAFGGMAGVISLIPLGLAAGIVVGVILPLDPQPTRKRG